MLSTCTVISVDDGLLRTSTGCAGPSFSLKSYAASSKFTMQTAIGNNEKHLLTL